MKYDILHDFRASAPFKEKSSDHLKDLNKLKLLTNSDVNLTSFLGGVMNYGLTLWRGGSSRPLPPQGFS